MSCSNGLVTRSEFFLSRSNVLVTRSKFFMSRSNGLVTRSEFFLSRSNSLATHSEYSITRSNVQCNPFQTAWWPVCNPFGSRSFYPLNGKPLVYEFSLRTFDGHSRNFAASQRYSFENSRGLSNFRFDWNNRRFENFERNFVSPETSLYFVESREIRRNSFAFFLHSTVHVACTCASAHPQNVCLYWSWLAGTVLNNWMVESRSDFSDCFFVVLIKTHDPWFWARFPFLSQIKVQRRGALGFAVLR